MSLKMSLFCPIVLIAIFSGTNKINTCRVYTFIVDLVLVVCCTVVQCRMRIYDIWFWLSLVI